MSYFLINSEDGLGSPTDIKVTHLDKKQTLIYKLGIGQEGRATIIA